MSQQFGQKKTPFVYDGFHNNNQRRAEEIHAAIRKGHQPCECPQGAHKDDCPNMERGTGTTLSQRSFGGPDYEDPDHLGQEGEFPHPIE